jgi:hypothetical protein
MFPIAPKFESIKNEKYVDPYYFVEKLSDKLRNNELIAFGSSGSCFTVTGQTLNQNKIKGYLLLKAWLRWDLDYLAQ